MFEYGWKLSPVPIWFEGDELPSKDEMDRLSSEDSEMSQSPHDVQMKSLTDVPQENIPNLSEIQFAGDVEDFVDDVVVPESVDSDVDDTAI